MVLDKMQSKMLSKFHELVNQNVKISGSVNPFILKFGNNTYVVEHPYDASQSYSFKKKDIVSVLSDGENIILGVKSNGKPFAKGVVYTTLYKAWSKEDGIAYFESCLQQATYATFADHVGRFKLIITDTEYKMYLYNEDYEYVQDYENQKSINCSGLHKDNIQNIVLEFLDDKYFKISSNSTYPYPIFIRLWSLKQVL